MNRSLLATRLATCLALILPLLHAAHAAGLPTPAELPSTEQVTAAIEQDPAVAQARHQLQAATHAAAMLNASPYEWTVSGTAQRRRVDGSPGSNEWSAQLERSIRIGGKASLDRDLGDAGLNLARAQVDAARNDSARLLLDLWLDGLAARQAREAMQEQVGVAEAVVKAVASRQKAGDASRLELNVAQGDLADVQRQASVALAAEAKAQTALRLRFPQVPQDARALPDPVPPEFDEAQWLERILATHPLLLSAQQALRKAELGSARTQAERTPDPTVGVFTSSEARRTERVVGLSFSIPFGGTYREQSARVALQEVEVARLGVARQRRDLALQVATQVQEAVSNVAQWRFTEHSASLLRETARLTQRAYGLGEADLQTLLLVKRQSLEATSAAAAMKADALRARYRLLVDAGMLWDLGGAQP